MLPLGHKQSGKKKKKSLAFSVPIVQWSSSTVPERRDKTKLDLLTFQMFRGDQYMSSREQLLQLSHMACRRVGCLFIHFSYFRPKIGSDMKAH